MLPNNRQDPMFWHSRHALANYGHMKAGTPARIEEIDFIHDADNLVPALLQGRSTSVYQCFLSAGIEYGCHPVRLAIASGTTS